MAEPTHYAALSLDEARLVRQLMSAYATEHQCQADIAHSRFLTTGDPADKRMADEHRDIAAQARQTKARLTSLRPIKATTA